MTTTTSSSPIASTFTIPTSPAILNLSWWLYKFYYWIQYFIYLLYARPAPSKPFSASNPPRGRIAIIGAGITGVSSAAHAIANGFDVMIFEQKDQVGGIWAAVNTTSGLQLNSFLYKFHPSVIWSCFFPKQPEIMNEISQLWNSYGLASKTLFNYTVSKVNREVVNGKTRWSINDNQTGIFDAIIVCVGTCGIPKKVNFPGRKTFKGPIVHSSQLAQVNMKNKKVVCLGSGASGVETVEEAVQNGAAKTVMLARSDKWIIPRNIMVSAVLGAQPLGGRTPAIFQRLLEYLLRKFHYKDLSDALSPSKNVSLFSMTPVLNDEMLELIRKNEVSYLRGDVIEIVPEGVKFNWRQNQESQPGDPGKEIMIEADILIESTGFHRPSIDFLPSELFRKGSQGSIEDYTPPNLYLQMFSPIDPTCVLTNSTYVEAIASAGHIHIGIFTRILLTFLTDPSSVPTSSEMCDWINKIKELNKNTPGGPFTFFTYTEIMLWILRFSLARPKSILFNFSGIDSGILFQKLTNLIEIATFQKSVTKVEKVKAM